MIGKPPFSRQIPSICPQENETMPLLQDVWFPLIICLVAGNDDPIVNPFLSYYGLVFH